MKATKNCYNGDWIIIEKHQTWGLWVSRTATGEPIYKCNYLATPPTGTGGYFERETAIKQGDWRSKP